MRTAKENNGNIEQFVTSVAQAREPLRYGPGAHGPAPWNDTRAIGSRTQERTTPHDSCFAHDGRPAAIHSRGIARRRLGEERTGGRLGNTRLWAKDRARRPGGASC